MKGLTSLTIINVFFEQKPSGEQVQQQLKYILQVHKSDKVSLCSSKENTQMEEVDHIEPELDADDAYQGAISGEMLLRMYSSMHPSGTSFFIFSKCQNDINFLIHYT